MSENLDASSAPARPSLAESIDLIHAGGKPFLVSGKLGEDRQPSFEEQQAGEQASRALPFVVTLGLSHLLGPEFPEIVAWAWGPWQPMVVHALYQAAATKPEKPWPLREPIEGLLDTPVMLVEVHPDNYPGFVDIIRAWYTVRGRVAPKVVQMLFPDTDGKFPIEEGVHMLAGWSQPLLDVPWTTTPTEPAEGGEAPVAEPVAPTDQGT